MARIEKVLKFRITKEYKIKEVKKMWDVFISHASEDKDGLVRPLAKQLTEIYKANVWYDEFSLEYGDSLLKSIEKGLQNSAFGVVVFSKYFFQKVWTDHEYTSLKTKEMLLEQKVIIPIWYNITKSEIAEYSLALADKYAISLGSNINIDDLAVKILKIIRPDIYNNLTRMHYFEEIVNNSNTITISNEEFSNIPVPPIRHEKISVHMKARLKLIHNSLKDVDTRSYDIYEQDFRRSTNLDREIIITELLTAAYLDCINKRQMTLKEKQVVYDFTFSLGNVKGNMPFSEDEINTFTNLLKDYIQEINAAIVVMEYKFNS
jgi:hypothetical protein